MWATMMWVECASRWHRSGAQYLLSPPACTLLVRWEVLGRRERQLAVFRYGTESGDIQRFCAPGGGGVCMHER